MGQCTGAAQIDFALDMNWTPTELGDFILDLEESKINQIFEGKDTKPRGRLNEILSLSLFYLLIHKNQRANPKHKKSQIEVKMEPYRKDHQLMDEVEPIAKWMLENKIPKSQNEIRQDNYPETIGKWIDLYTKAMSNL